jgi:hypothetical protein
MRPIFAAGECPHCQAVRSLVGEGAGVSEEVHRGWFESGRVFANEEVYVDALIVHQICGGCQRFGIAIVCV